MPSRLIKAGPDRTGWVRLGTPMAADQEGTERRGRAQTILCAGQPTRVRV